MGVGTRLAIGTVVFVLLAAAVAVVFAKPVIGWYRQRTADAAATAEHATDDAEGRKLEVEGTQELTTAASDLSTAVADMKGAANALERKTRADPAMRTTIPAGELARLREHDRVLCSSGLVCRENRPAAQAGSPDRGNGALPPLDVAGE